jgi:hypothetical protein
VDARPEIDSEWQVGGNPKIVSDIVLLFAARFFMMLMSEVGDVVTEASS